VLKVPLNNNKPNQTTKDSPLLKCVDVLSNEILNIQKIAISEMDVSFKDKFQQNLIKVKVFTDYSEYSSTVVRM